MFLIYRVIKTLFNPRILSFQKTAWLETPHRMVVFTQKINGMTGTLEWDVKDDSYDYHQEIARAAFADMLHDTERNQKYFAGLKAAIEKMHSSGKQANVLDIGTGTGLLSIMAAQCGADSIVACEAFQPMSECALKIIKDNGFENLIKLIPKRSTDIVVGEGWDMEKKANILVTEVFDTELIGEGALETFTHAHQFLLEEDCIVVPHSATIYAQVVECPKLQKWNKVMDIADDDGDILVRTPIEVKQCSGSAAVHDIQLSQLERTHFKEISKPLAVLHYDWSGKTSLPKNITKANTLTALVTGNAQMVFMWWDLVMDTDGNTVLSCAPWWNHSDANVSVRYPQDTIPWRDHWMQAVYYFPTPLAVNQGDLLTLVSSQDEFSLWFNVVAGNIANKEELSRNEVFIQRPVCTCGIHMTNSRTHIAYINDSVRNKKMLRVLHSNVNKDSVVLCFNGSSVLGLAAAKMGAKRVFYLETGIISKRILNSYIDYNQLNNVQVVEDIQSLIQSSDIKDVSIVLGDPDYHTALLPWDNLHSGHILHKYKEEFNMSLNLTVIPGRCTLWTMAVEFLDLHKIKAPLNVCENIDMKLFDQLIKNSRAISDDEIEPQPLWEYPCLCRSEPVQILEVTLKDTQQVTSNTGKKDCQIGATYNGFVLWVEWSLDDDSRNNVSTGPTSQPIINQRVSWDSQTRQGVKILEQSCIVKEGEMMKYSCKCDLLNGTINIDVSIS